MDIYQIIMTHNRMWTAREIAVFSVIVLCAFVVCIHLIRYGKIRISQGIAAMLLIFFLGIVFGSTVFTRTATVREYELVPLWSWREVILHHDMFLLQENLLNCILLMPVGILLPFIAGHKVGWKTALMIGVLISAVIETSQLVFMRGLFEWDDMIHNGIGCIMGCAVMNRVWEKTAGKKCICSESFHRNKQKSAGDRNL